MFIIFGWAKSVKPVESVLKSNCYKCLNNAGWTVWKDTDWVSLFFIKVLPVNSNYRLACDICQDSLSLSGSEAIQTLDQDRRNRHLHDALISKIEKHQFRNMTDNQIKYRKAKFDGGI